MIKYRINDTINVIELRRFFQYWKAPPSDQIRRKMIKGSDLIVTARKGGILIGFLSAISDHAMHAFITLLEVLPEYGGQGVGRKLVKLATSKFKGFYDIILTTDPDKSGFYKKFGFKDIHGMHLRNYQYGKKKLPRKGE